MHGERKKLGVMLPLGALRTANRQSPSERKKGVAAENHKDAWEKSPMESTDHEEGEGSKDFRGNERLNGEREATPTKVRNGFSG